MKLPIVDFPEKNVTTKECFTDEEALASVHNEGNPEAFLPKVERTYGKVIFPKTKKYPYSFASIALSMDGKMAYPNRPEGVLVAKANTLNPDGALTDYYVLNFLRAYGDVVINGTKTLDSEPNMWMTVQDEDLVKERKENLGKKLPHPNNVIITLDGTDVPLDHNIFNQQEVPISLFTTPEGWEYLNKHGKNKFYLLAAVKDINDCDFEAIGKGMSTCSEQVPVITTGGNGKTDIPLYMEAIRGAGMEHILIESPTFMWLLMKEKLMSEIFMTHTTTFTGGTLTPGYGIPFTFEDHPQSEILRLNRHGNSFIFTRQKISYS